MNITLTKELIKTQVKIIRTFLKEGGQDISQSSAYVLVAKMYGQESWHHLSAILKDEDKDYNNNKGKE